MTQRENKASGHVDSAKKEMKNAAAVIIEGAKEKVESVVADVAEKIGNVADHVHNEVKK